MAARSSRGRRTRSAAKPATARTAATDGAENGDAGKHNDRVPSHLAHHRMIARNLNGLLENYGELRNQVVQIERDFKRSDKELDTQLFQLRNQLDAVDKKLTDFTEEVTSVVFESNLKIRGNSDQAAALWDALAVVSGQTDEVKRRRDEAAAREETRQAQVDQRLQDLVDEQKAKTRAPRRRRKATTKK